MEFYDFLTTYDHAHGHGLPADVTLRRFYLEAAATSAMLALGGAKQYRCEHNRAVCEWDWHELGRPHYKVHPGVLPLLMDVGVDIPVEYLKLPFTSFLLRLPKQDNPLVINASLRVESILVSSQRIRDNDDRRSYLWIATGEVDQSGFPVLTYSQLACTPGTSIEEAFHALPRQPMGPDRRADRVMPQACGLDLLSGDPIWLGLSSSAAAGLPDLSQSSLADRKLYKQMSDRISYQSPVVDRTTHKGSNMHRHHAGRYVALLICLCADVGYTEPGPICAAAEQAEILGIMVGEPTTLSKLAYQNTASLAVSRQGVIAAFYPKPGTAAKFYRTSTDGGATWGRVIEFPSGNASRMSVALPEGGVLFLTGQAKPVAGGKAGEQEASFLVFSDDFLRYETGIAPVFLPNVVMHTRWARFWPPFDKGKIVRLPNDDLLATLYGDLQGDSQYRTMIARSTDRGRSWKYHASVAYQPDDPDPQFVGGFCGYCEPSLALLANGQLLCLMRTQGAEIPNEYRPLYASWSDDVGKTWSTPEPTKPDLMNISPTLAVLDNGVVVCQYGRPGFHVVFSMDHGHTWRDRISFSHLPEPIITGQFDMIKVGPNRLAAIGSDADGTKVWPISVERVAVSETRVTLTGRVLDERDNPIAGVTVQRSPNRHDANDWTAIPTPNGEKPRFAEPLFDSPRICSTPVLSYRSIDDADGHPSVQTDGQGRFRFDDVSLGETILTVEAQGYAPRHRQVKVEPQPSTPDFTLKPGRQVRGRLTDDAGLPIAGACVVLDAWHTHTDDKGFFHWSAEAPLPVEVAVKIYKRYSNVYATLDQKLSLASIAEDPIILSRTK